MVCYGKLMTQVEKIHGIEQSRVKKGIWGEGWILLSMFHLFHLALARLTLRTTSVGLLLPNQLVCFQKSDLFLEILDSVSYLRNE